MARIRIAFAILIPVLFSSLLFAQNQEPAKPPSPTTETTPLVPIIPKDEHTVVGWLDVIPIQSKILHNTRMLRVWVPGNYLSPHNAHRKYPVLYMQDGQNLFDKATSFAGEWEMDETMDHLIGSFKVEQMFVVGIDNAGDQRNAEYLPYPDPHNPQSPGAQELRSKEYEKFLLTEVMPYLEKKYRIATGAANTGVGGSSYGAVIALHLALEHPATFGHVLIESPPLWLGEGQLLKDAEKAKVLPRKMYIGVGTSESENQQEASEEVAKVRELEKLLRSKGMGPDRLKVVVEEHATHNEGAWSRRLPEAVLFLYGRSN
jgi:predicted alpha/beta superfamily hydrolase